MIEFGIITHGVNCSNAMNSGVAGAIKKKYPQVAKEYHKLAKKKGLRLIGYCQFIHILPNRLYVANCFTQKFYGYNGRFAIPSAIEESLLIAYNYANIFNLPIFMPKIGCGLGGLNWDSEVEPIIADLDSRFDNVETYICEL